MEPGLFQDMAPTGAGRTVKPLTAKVGFAPPVLDSSMASCPLLTLTGKLFETNWPAPVSRPLRTRAPLATTFIWVCE